MKVQVSGKSLAEALSVVKGATTRRPLNPILAMVKLTAKGKVLTVTGTDGEVQVWMDVTNDVAVIQEGSLVVDPERLSVFLRQSGHEVEISLGKKVILKGSGIKLELAITSVDSFPDSRPDLSDGLALPSDIWKRMLLSVLPTMGGEKDGRIDPNHKRKYDVNLVMLDAHEGNLVVESTRITCIARSTHPYEGDVKMGVRAVLLPANAAKVLARCLGSGDAMAWWSRNICQFRGDGWQLRSVIAKEYAYPPTDKLFRENMKVRGTVDVFPAAMVAALKSVALAADERWTSGVDCLMSGKLLKMTVESSLGDGEASIPVNYDGPELDWTFDAELMADYLSTVGTDQVTMRLKDDLLATLIQTSDGRKFLLANKSEGPS